LQDCVTLLGALSQDEVAGAYRRAALFALPCVVGADGNRDGLPTVLLEAMAMRLPVVSTGVTGVPEIVDDGVNGYVVPQHDAEALAGALERLLADPALRERLGAAGRDKVERVFNLQRNGAVLREWLTEGAASAVPAVAPQPAFAR
jgi:glycosyltransferase involved in cell wall biosynthesis